MKRSRVLSGADGEETLDEMYRRLMDQEDGFLPLPAIASDPHLLTNKIRQHYLKAVTKMLCLNYESSQKLAGKHVRLPSAIWRCAKTLELQAVQACMLMQLYRENILGVIKQLKADTDKGKLHKRLFDSLLNPPKNDKGVQVNLEKKRKRTVITDLDMNLMYDSISGPQNNNTTVQPIPVLVNMEYCNNSKTFDANTDNTKTFDTNTDNTKDIAPHTPISIDTPKRDNDTQEKETVANKRSTDQRLSVESMEVDDKIMLEMEKLFKTNDTDEDIFEETLCNNFELTNDLAEKKDPQETEPQICEEVIPQPMPTLDERIAMLNSSGVLAEPPPPAKKPPEKPKKQGVSKWICELYYHRLKLSETMDMLIETNRKKHERVKRKFLVLFGEDEEEYLAMSPPRDEAELLASCTERLAPHVVKYLMKYYNAGRIKSKALFKGVARHIIDTIISYNQFPGEYEVYTFLTDYFKGRPVIRCVADF